MLAMLGSALGAFGATLTHTPNQAAEMMRDTINASLEAQKAEIKGKEKNADNAYARLLSATGDEKQADAAFRQMGYQVADSQAQELGAHVRDAQLMGELRNGLANAAKEDFGQDMATMRFAQGGVAGGIDMKMAQKRVQEIRDEGAKGGKDVTPMEAWRQAVEEQRPGTQTGGFQSYAKTGSAGGGRAAATAAHYENMLNEARTGRDAVTELQKIVAAGGQNTPALRAKVRSLNERSISSMAAVLQNGQTPTNESRAAAKLQHPDLPSRTEWTDEDKTLLDTLAQFYDEKLGQAKNTKQQLGTDPWATRGSESDAAAESGAKEE
jgi:hypothetical protein